MWNDDLFWKRPDRRHWFEKLQLLQIWRHHFAHLLGLTDRSRESVEEESIFTLGSVEIVFDESQNEFVIDQFPRIDDLLDLGAKLGPAVHLGAKEISRSQVTYGKELLQSRRLEKTSMY